MNSKQRIKTILAHGQADRPGLGFFAIDSDTAGEILGRKTYWRNKAACKIAFWEGRRDEVVQSWIADAIELYKKLDVIDLIPLCNGASGICPPKDYDPDPPRKIDESTWEDKAGCIYKYSEDTNDITMIHDPQTWTRQYKVEDEIWDGMVEQPDESIFEAVDAIIAEFKDDRFIIGTYGMVEGWLLQGGMERGFMEIAERGDEVKQIYDSYVKRADAQDPYYIRDGQDGVMFGTDFCSKAGPMINPQTYRQLFLPGYSRRIKHLKDQGQFFIQHACGNNWPMMDTFVDMGIDCYQSIQTSAGMDIVEVQKKYGDKFALWGGVSVENLIEGTTDDICKDVRYVMENVAPNGGFILGTTHSVAVGTKYDNFMALLDEFSRYQ